jgi:hypothetical protein
MDEKGFKTFIVNKLIDNLMENYPVETKAIIKTEDS